MHNKQRFLFFFFFIHLVFAVFCLFPQNVNAASGESEGSSFTTHLPYSIGSNVQLAEADCLFYIDTVRSGLRISQELYPNAMLIVCNVQGVPSYVFPIFYSDDALFTMSAGGKIVIPDSFQSDQIGGYIRYSDVNILSSNIKLIINNNKVCRSTYVFYYGMTTGYGDDIAYETTFFGNPLENSYYPVYIQGSYPSIVSSIGGNTYNLPVFRSSSGSGHSIGADIIGEVVFGDSGLGMDPDDSTPVTSESWLKKIYNRLGGFNNNVMKGFSALAEIGKNILDKIGSGSGGSAPDLSGVVSRIDSISGKIDVLKTAMNNGFTSIFNFLSFPDQQYFDSRIKNLSIYQLYLNLDQIKEDFLSIRDSISRPDRVVFELDFSDHSFNILGTSFNYGIVEINFDWFTDDVRHMFDWLYFFVFFGFILGVFFDLPNIISGLSGGKGGEDS